MSQSGFQVWHWINSIGDSDVQPHWYPLELYILILPIQRDGSMADYSFICLFLIVSDAEYISTHFSGMPGVYLSLSWFG